MCLPSFHPPLLLIILAALLGCGARVEQRDPTVQPPPVREFSARTQEYVELHRRVEALREPLGETTDGNQIPDRRRELAAALRRARADAHRGDIFAPEVATYFREIIVS